MQRFTIAVLAPAVLAVACGGAPDGGAEVLTAEPYPREIEAQPLEDEPEPDEADPSTPEQDEASGGDDEQATDDGPAEEAAGPRPADAAAYVAEHVPADALARDVLLLDEPKTPPRLLLAVVTNERRGVLEAARWTGHAFERAARVDAGPAESLGTLRTPRVGKQRLVALGLRHDGELRIGMWRLAEDRLAVPEACPVAEPREIRRQGTDVEIGCHGHEGVEGRLVWHDGAFRSTQAAVPGRAQPEPPEAADRAERSQGQGPPDHAEEAPRAQPDREAPRAQPDRPDAAGGRSDAADDPPGTQGRGPRSR